MEQNKELCHYQESDVNVMNKRSWQLIVFRQNADSSVGLLFISDENNVVVNCLRDLEK